MAARNIQQLFDLVDYIVRKQRGVFITGTEFDEVLDAAQLEAYAYYWSGYGIDQTIHDALQPFKVLRNPYTSTSSGLVSFPSDYLHLLAGVSAIYGSTITPVTFLNPDQVPDAITNQLRPVVLANPVAEDYSFKNPDGTITLGFQMYPMSTQIGYYSYMRRPAQPHYGYTQVNRVITYDPTTSVQLEFTDIYVNNIISRSLKYFSINMSEQEIEVFAQTQQQETK